MFTVLGASGFVGSHLCNWLRYRGHGVFAPGRGDDEIYHRNLGHVIYCIGVTADFRHRPHDTVDAHVTVLADILRRCRFESLLFLSSTRVYGADGTGREDTPVSVSPSDPGDLYNISKLAGEAMCLASPDPRLRVARLANIFADDMEAFPSQAENFLPSIVRAAAIDGTVSLRTSLLSAKDYIAIDDVVRALERIAVSGRHRLYNVASGRNVSHGEILDALCELTGCRVEVATDAPQTLFPPLATDRIVHEFLSNEPWRPIGLLDCLEDIVGHYRHPKDTALDAAMEASA